MSLKMRKPLLITPDRSIAPLPPKTSDEFYGSRAWKTVRAEVIARRGRTCEMCGRVDARPFVDHVRELKDKGAALDPANLMVVCGSCHTRKTAAMRAARQTQGGT